MLDQNSLPAFTKTLEAFGVDELFDPSIPARVWIPESSAKLKAERIYILGAKLQDYARRLIGAGQIGAGPVQETPAPEPEPEPEPVPDPEDEAAMADTRDVTLAEDGFPATRAGEGRRFLAGRMGTATVQQAGVPKSVGRGVVGAPRTMPAPLDRPESGDDSRRHVERFPPGQRGKPLDPSRLAPLDAERSKR